jgi:hypothetical protein
VDVSVQEKERTERQSEVIIDIIRRNEEIRRQNEEFERRKAAEIQARRDAVVREREEREARARQLRARIEQEEIARLKREREIINRSPECRSSVMTLPELQECKRRVEKERFEKGIANTRAKAGGEFIDAAERQLARDVDDAVARATLFMETHNCGYGENNPPPIQNLSPSGPADQQVVSDLNSRINRINALQHDRFIRALRDASDDCEHRKRAGALRAGTKDAILAPATLTPVTTPPSTTPVMTPPSTLKAPVMSADEKRRLQVQQKARTDLDAAIQRGQGTIDQAAAAAKDTKDGNARLKDLVDKIR